MAEAYDFIVIGGGSAGYAAANTARRHCERVAIIDDAETLGGLCILRGCMPSKTLLYSAEVLHHAHQAKTLGLEIPEARVDMRALQARKQRLVKAFQSYRLANLTGDRFTLFRERARFTDAHTLRLETSGTELTAPHCVIATGSHINVPDVPGLRDASLPILDSDSLQDAETLPESVLVLGGGTIACEMTQFLARAGVQVTLIQRSGRILKELPEEASAAVTEAFRQEGIRVETDTALKRLEATDDGVAAVFDCRGQEQRVTAAAALNALGRKPNTGGLGLEQAGVELERGRILTDTHQRTSAQHIYAAGDVTGPYEIVHLAVLQGEYAAAHALGLKPTPINYDHRTSVIFTDPQVAMVGMTPDEARQRGLDAVSESYPFGDSGKSIIMEAHLGYVRVTAERLTHRIVGAECVGRDGGELIHALAVAVSLGATPQQLLRTHWYHPTLSEVWTYPLEALVERFEDDAAAV